MKSHHKLSKLGIYLVLLLLSFTVIGISVANYASCIVFLVGVALSFLGTSVVLSLWEIGVLRTLLKRLSESRFLRVLGFMLGLLGLLGLLRWLLVLSPPCPCAITRYQAILQPDNPSLGTFSITETIAFSPQFLEQVPFTPPVDWEKGHIDEDIAFRLPGRQVTSTSLGLVLREVSFSLPKSVFSAEVFSRGLGSKHLACACMSTVELHNFPKNSFYVARDAWDVANFPYVNTETVTWSVKGTAAAFAYIPPPYHHLRPLLKPLIEVSSLSQWVIGLVGVAFASITTIAIRPTLSEIVKSKLKAWIDKQTGKKTKERVRLVVSSRGEEKEVEVAQDD